MNDRIKEIKSKAVITKSKLPVIDGNAPPGEATAEFKEVVMNLSDGDFNYILQCVEELEEQNYFYRRKLKNIRLMCSSVDAYDKETIPLIYEEVNKAIRGESE